MNEEIKEKIRSKFKFCCAEEKLEFDEYVFERKGIDLYLEVLNIFKVVFPKEKEFYYQEIASFIKHDKSLRDFLFGYIAYIEEWLRTQILEKFTLKDEYKIKEKIKHIPIKNVFDNLIDREDFNQPSKLFKEMDKIFLSDLIVIHQEKISTKGGLDLSKIKDLRNKIMHHQLILIENTNNIEEIQNGIDNLNQTFKLIKTILPPNYIRGFENKLKSLIKADKCFFTRINIGGIVNGSAKK